MCLDALVRSALFPEAQRVGQHILDLCFIELLFPGHHGRFGHAVFDDLLPFLRGFLLAFGARKISCRGFSAFPTGPSPLPSGP